MRIIPLALLILPFHIAAQEYVLQYDTLFTRQNEALGQSPALYALRQPCSKTDISVSFRRTNFDTAPFAETGKGAGIGSFNASTYLHSGKATITGFATYDNGKIFDIQGSETSDAALLYPYLSADERGGDMRHERYRFGGSYTSTFAHNCLYGAEISYNAVQDYRQRDPRPKNTVGDLNIRAGIGYGLSRYDLALGINLSKYKQNSSIIFKSELGQDKIYHTTGLGTDYKRFGGQGYSSVYKGTTWGLKLSIAPHSYGVFANIGMERFSFKKQITDLNHLPLVDADDNRVNAQIGWQTKQWIACATIYYDKRSGKENIFGDPSAQVYPQIATVDGYKREISGGYASAVWRVISSNYRVDVNARLGFEHRHENYQGQRDTDMKLLPVSITGEYVLTLKKINIHASLQGKYTASLSHSCHGLNGDDFLSRIALHDFETASGNAVALEFRPGIDYVLPHGRCLGVRLGAAYYKLKDNNGVDLQTSVIFSF